MYKIRILLTFFTAFNASAIEYAINDLLESGKDYVQHQLKDTYPESDTRISVQNFKKPSTYKCEQKPEFVFDQHTNSLQKGILYISCENSWQMRIPLAINIYKEVVVAKTGLARNQVMSKDDVALHKLDITRTQEGFTTNLDDVIGKKIMRSHKIYQAISTKFLREPTVVKRGSLVEIRLKTAQLQINMPGMAEESGALFEVIRVKNLSSNKVVNAKIVAKDKTQVYI